MSFGNQIFNTKFYISNQMLKQVESITYLGIIINSDLDFDSIATEKYKKVYNNFFNISFLGLEGNNVSYSLKSFIFKTYCLSNFTYGLGITTLKNETKDFLNKSQNNLIKIMLGIKYRCHMTNILKALKIFNFDQLYIFSKLTFINTIRYSSLASYILECMKNLPERSANTRFRSFADDLNKLKNYFEKDISFTPL